MHISKDHRIFRDGDDIYISKTDAKGRFVIHFLHFQNANSKFGVVHLKYVEKNSKEIAKINLFKAGCLQKNSFLSKWSQVNQILSYIKEYEMKDADYLKFALDELNQMSCSDTPHFQFIYAQLQLLLSSPEGRRYD